MQSSSALSVVTKRNQYINKILHLPNCKNFEKKISAILNIPRKTLFFENCQILSKDWNFIKKDFNNFLLKNFFKYFIYNILLNILNLFGIFKKKSKPYNYDILVEGISSDAEANRWLELSKYVKKTCFSGNNFKRNKSKKIHYLFFKKYFLLFNNNLSFLTKLKILWLSIEVLIYSIIDEKNYFLLFNNILYKYLKYNFIFSNVNSKFMIEEKFYATSELKNFLFKKSGGKKSACIQKNILQLGISSFISTDIFFSLGKNTAKIIKKLGGKFEEIYPVGSLFMEETWFKKKKDIEKIKNIDLLIIGINVKSVIHKLVITGNFEKGYYEHINWVAKFSNAYPKIKVVLKHHANHNIDLKEKEILKNSKVETIIKSKSHNKTYGYVFKSKAVCSFGSTMIMEFLGHGKSCFFLDPSLKAQQFYDCLPQIDKKRISTYSEFEKKILYIIKNKKFSQKILKKNVFCFESSSVSKRIFDYFDKKISYK